MKDLSIIIVSYNTERLLSSCIESVEKGTKGLDYEIILVDNASKDGSREFIKNISESRKHVKAILNRDNLGFSKANNQGIKLASGRYILLLNSDTEIKDNVLNKMVRWMDNHQKVGVSTCALRNRDSILQPTGGYFPTILRVFAWMLFLDDLPLLGKLIKSFHPHSPDFLGDNQDFLKKHEQDWITGAFFLVRRIALNEAGNLDEEYFMYFEEVDLCWRIKKKGWQIWYLPDWSIIHLGGASSNKEFAILSEYKEIKRFYKKFFPFWQFLLLKILLKAGALIRIVAFAILGGSESAKIYYKAYKYV